MVGIWLLAALTGAGLLVGSFLMSWYGSPYYLAQTYYGVAGFALLAGSAVWTSL